MRRRTCLTTVVALLLLPLAACGTTVSGARSGAGSSGVGLGSNGPGGGAGAVPATGGLTPTQPGVGQPQAGGSGGTTLGGRPGAPVTTTQGPVTALAPAAPLTIGVAVIADYNTIGAFGARINTPTAQQYEHEFNAITAYLNQHGGIAGHRIVPVYDEVKFLTGSDYQSQAQSMCSFFTQDHHVFAVVLFVDAESSVLPSCLAKAHTVMLDGLNSLYLGDDETASYGPYYYRLNALPFRDLTTYVDELVASGFLKPGNKIGLLRYDLPQQQWADQRVLRPALAKHGLKLSDEFVYNYLNSSSDLSSAGSQSSNAVLKFRAEGIDRVLLVDSQAPIPFTFMPVAESQQYRPRYALTSADLPNFLSQNVPAAQLAGAIGLGFDKAEDMPPRNWSDPTWRTCYSIVSKTDAPSAQLAAFDCDRFFFLKQTLDAAGTVSAPAMRLAAQRLAPRFPASAGFGLSLAPGRNDGVSGYRMLGFDAGCACFTYTSPVRFVR